MLHVGEAKLVRALSEKVISSFGSLTSGQVLVATGATVGVVALVENSANTGLAKAASIEAEGLEREAARFEKENLPCRAALCRAEANIVRKDEEARYPGGPVVASLSNTFVGVVKSCNPQSASEPVPDSDRVQQFSRLERLKSLQEDAKFENERQVEDLRRFKKTSGAP